MNYGEALTNVRYNKGRLFFATRGSAHVDRQPLLRSSRMRSDFHGRAIAIPCGCRDRFAGRYSGARRRSALGFLGPEWDKQLTDAYTSGRAERLLQPRGLGVIFNSSLYRGRPLEELVDHYFSAELIQAVAREAASGRLLLVATTNVDTGETVVWDLGSIALNGGSGAKTLFRDVLVASASVPGMFPPVIIRVQDAGGDYSEAHVDGASTVPFLIPPSLLQLARDVPNRSPTTVYVLVDARLTQEPVPTRVRFRTILSRSMSAGLTHMMRANLELTATSAQLQGASFQYSAIPADYPSPTSFDFRASNMRSLFQYGHDCAYTLRLWIPSPRPVAASADRSETVAGKRVECPADDDFIGHFRRSPDPGHPAVSPR